MIRSPLALVMGLLVTSISAAAGASPSIRVAVLDFQGSGSVGGDYESLGAGLQSMLTSDLTTSSTITVVERARLADVRKELNLGRSGAVDPKTAAKLGHLAGASHLVTGTFTLVGNKLRLDARVIDVKTGQVALATNADGDRETFFELEKKVAGAIIAQLGVTLTPKERASFARVQTADWEAFRKFGDGLRLFDDGEYDRSLEALRQATARDQEFRLASSTLETYERLAREVRGRAGVIEAEQQAKVALARRQLREQDQAVVDRLVALAAHKEGGAAARARRAAALYLIVRVLDDPDDEGVDRFARERLLDAFVARYVHEADGLFPDLPMVPFEPMGERYHGPDRPKTPADAERAVTAAVEEFAHYGYKPKDADEIHQGKEEHIQSLFRKELDRTAHCMHLDDRRAVELMDHFYTESVRFSPRGRWRGEALVARAKRRRALLDVDESTRLYKEAAGVETDPRELRDIARQIETNGKIASVLASGGAAPCLHEWAAAVVVNDGEGIDRRFESDSKHGDLCASDLVQFARRRIGNATLFGNLPVWIFEPDSRPLTTGPRSGPDHVGDLRYLARKDDRSPWVLVVLEGAPHTTAAVSFELAFDPPADLPLGRLCGGRTADCLPPGERPTVTALFDATSVLVRAPRHGNDTRENVPMQAIGVSLGAESAQRIDANVVLASEMQNTVGAKLTAGDRQPLPALGSGKVAVTVRREDRRLIVDAGAQHVAFDAPPARGGFLGLLVQGRGFVRIAAPRVQPSP
jgi:TolB-like protein